jgi:hypothetical protein
VSPSVCSHTTAEAAPRLPTQPRLPTRSLLPVTLCSISMCRRLTSSLSERSCTVERQCGFDVQLAARRIKGSQTSARSELGSDRQAHMLAQGRSGALLRRRRVWGGTPPTQPPLSHVPSVGRRSGANSTASCLRRGFFNEAPALGVLFLSLCGFYRQSYLHRAVPAAPAPLPTHQAAGSTTFLQTFFSFCYLPPPVASFCAGGELVIADLAPRLTRPRALWHGQLSDPFFFYDFFFFTRGSHSPGEAE